MRGIILKSSLFFLMMQPIFHVAKAHDKDALSLFDSPEAEAERVLGVSSCPTYEQVRAAYKEKARTCHPDKNRNPAQQTYFTEKMANLTAAYTILKEWLGKNGSPESVSEEKAEQSAFQAEEEEAESFAQSEQTADQAKEGGEINAQEAFDPYLLPPHGYEQGLRTIESKMRCEVHKNPELIPQWGVYRRGSFDDRLNEFTEALQWFHRKYGANPFGQKYAHVQQLLGSVMRMLPFYRTLKGVNYQGTPDDVAEFYAINLVGNFPHNPANHGP